VPTQFMVSLFVPVLSDQRLNKPTIQRILKMDSLTFLREVIDACLYHMNESPMFPERKITREYLKYALQLDEDLVKKVTYELLMGKCHKELLKRGE
jgi:hypothetical protein